ncbi:hypothetical protein HUW63_32830 [Myxococcus sp. AM001]|nr:hypothetical protein [Myxococcus sp. AM001]
MLVEGIRGAGKSLWWHALLSNQLRHTLAVGLGARGFGASLRVSAGWSNVSRTEYPDRDTLEDLLRKKHLPRLIWKTIIAVQTTDLQEIRSGQWTQRVSWVKAHPEELASAFRAANERLVSQKSKHLVLFDALDRTAGPWNEIRALLKGLLENLLELRSSPAIRAKAFIRPDMLDDPSVQAFPDASKVIASRVSLDWPKTDLYGLLWQYLGNADSGTTTFRKLAEAVSQPSIVRDEIWRMPDGLRSDEKQQRRLLERLAGPYMGPDRRRGITYVWLPSHLADVHEKVSPRSFLSALRHAASIDALDGQEYPLHWNAIKHGVGKASEYRVEELVEDYPWIRPVMEPLEDLVIPCERTDIVKRWKKGRVIDNILRLTDPRRPSRIDNEYDGLLVDLEEMGVFADIGEGRLNMPDVYRIGFRLRRRGGIKPVE